MCAVLRDGVRRSVRTVEVFPVINFIVHFERHASDIAPASTADMLQAVLDKRTVKDELHLAGKKRCVCVLCVCCVCAWLWSCARYETAAVDV